MVDYPLKQSLCLPYYILFCILIINGAIKYLFRHFMFVKAAEKVHHQKYLAERNTMRHTFSTLSQQHRNQYLLEYQSLIYLCLNKLFPDDISLLIIDFYLPLNTHLEQTESVTLQIKSLNNQRNNNHKQPLCNFTSFESWCDAHNHLKDIDSHPKYVGHGRRQLRITSHEFGDQLMYTITTVMNTHYIPKHNENLKHQNVASLLQKYDTIQKAQSIYTAVKICMELISTIIMFIAFFEWSAKQYSAFEQFNGFVLLLYYHPSFTFVNMMPYVDTSKRGLGDRKATRWMPIFPWILIFYLFFDLKRERNIREYVRNDKQLRIEKYLKVGVAFNVFCVWMVWLITIPWVFFGGFRYISLMFFVYCGIAIAVVILYCLVNGSVAIMNKLCGLRLRLDWDTIRPLYMWGLTFFYHSTSIMYINVVAGNWGSITGTYCDSNLKYIDVNIDWRNWKIIWIVLSWII